MKKGLFLTIIMLILNTCVKPTLGQEILSEENLASNTNSQIGGPNSVNATLEIYNKRKDTLIKDDYLLRALNPYFDFKTRIKERYDFSFSFDYHALIQNSTASLAKHTAIGGVVRFFGRWDLIGKGSGNTGTFVYKVENRHRLGTETSPVNLGSEIGYAGFTDTTFSDTGWELTNFFWEQQLLNRRLIIIAGVVDTTDYVDVYSMVNPWTDFSNQVFLTNPTIPAPSQGLGAAAVVLLNENIYVLGGFADTNGDPTDPWGSVNTFFDQAEYFYHLEFGWISSFENRFADNIHITAWFADKRDAEDVPYGWGVTFSFNRLFADKWEPFVRAGYADDGGALLDKDISLGLGYYTQQKSGLLAVGLSWGEPSEQSFGTELEDQYTVEIFYRMQLLQNVTITPDIQLIVDPALNPEEDVIAVFGLRGGLTL